MSNTTKNTNTISQILKIVDVVKGKPYSILDIFPIQAEIDYLKGFFNMDDTHELIIYCVAIKYILTYDAEQSAAIFFHFEPFSDDFNKDIREIERVLNVLVENEYLDEPETPQDIRRLNFVLDKMIVYHILNDIPLEKVCPLKKIEDEMNRLKEI